jgi:hypothetical protein
MARKIRLEKRAVLSDTSVPAPGDAESPSADGTHASASPSRRRRIPRTPPGSGATIAGGKALGIVAAVAIVVTLLATLLQRPTPAVTEGATAVGAGGGTGRRGAGPCPRGGADRLLRPAVP